MIAFVLAAGEGSRLRPLTERVPKPMIELFGYPLLEYNVRMLVSAGIRELIINLHYLPDVVRDHFGDGSAFGANITYSYEATLLGTAGALNPVRERLTEPFLLVYGDNLTTIDLPRFIAHHQVDRLATIALFSREDVSQSGVVELDRHGIVRSFVEKPKPGETESHWVNAGLVVAEPGILNYVPPSGVSDFGRDIFPAVLRAGKSLGGYEMSPTEGLWWIDTLEDHRRTNADEDLRALARARFATR